MIDTLPANPRYPDVGTYTTFRDGCNRVYVVDSRPTAQQIPPALVGPNSYSSSWDCSYAYTLTSYSGGGGGGHLCYYYPTERNIQVDSGGAFPLPDLVEVALTYLYDPIPTEISSKTPIGNGFTLVEHARGRLEPALPTTPVTKGDRLMMRKGRVRRGQALTELAIAIPVLALMIFGLIKLALSLRHGWCCKMPFAPLSATVHRPERSPETASLGSRRSASPTTTRST